MPVALHNTLQHSCWAVLALLAAVLVAMQSTSVYAENYATMYVEQDLLIDDCHSWQMEACNVAGRSPQLYDRTVMPVDFYQQHSEGEIYTDMHNETGRTKRFSSISFKSSRQYLLGGLKKRVQKLRSLTSPLNDDQRGRRLYMDLESDGAALTFQINY